MSKLPEGWAKCKVSEICTLQNGNSFKPYEWDVEGLPIIRIQNLNGSDNFNYFSGTPSDKWLVETGQLLFSWAGTKGVSFGPFVWKGPKGVLNQHIYKVFNKDGILKDWLYLALKYITHNIENKAHGFKATLLHVQKKDIDNQMVLVPSGEEQQKIAKILSIWDKAISITEQLISNSQQQKKMLAKLLMLKNLAGENWSHHYFGEVVLISKAKFNPKVEQKIVECIELEHISQGDSSLLGSTTTEQAISTKSVFNKGNVLFGKLRPYLRKYWLADRNGVCSTEIWVLIANEEKITQKYLHQLVQLDSFIDVANLASGTHMPRADWNVVKNAPVELPPLPEQQKIAKFLSTADREIELLQQKLAGLKQEKQALMQQLLTGKRRVAL